ncbi:hypothetical protein DFQ26_004762 [Actinomortierella ambigua]|nr:hypothetical protein DFQ26_004762 [Actinomortierella ambigua]
MFAPNGIMPMIQRPPLDDSSSASSVKSGKSGKSGKSLSNIFSKDNNSSEKGDDKSLHHSNSVRSGSISSAHNQPTSASNISYHSRSIDAVYEEPEYDQFGYDPRSPQRQVDQEQHRSSLQWLQQTCRPVFLKELEKLSSVPVPITSLNAQHPSMIGGSMQVQVASWKQSKVQILPIERWGNPQDVLLEIQNLHRLRKCRNIIQLYGYLPNSNPSIGQVPALLLQQPSYGSLREFLNHHFASLQWPEKYKIGLDIAQGLRFLIAQNVPCELNSGNILIDAEGAGVLTGFGVPGGMVTSAPCQMTFQPSSASMVVYMAPERLQGREYSYDWSVYSLGVLLWELSSGKMPFDEIIARAEAGPRLAKSMEQLSSAIVKGLREETVADTPEIYEQLFKMCWAGEAEARPPLDVVEETLQMLVVVEPMDMLLLSEDISLPGSTVVSENIDTDSINGATRSNSLRSLSPVPSHLGSSSSFARPKTLHQAVAASNADMTEWYILSGHDVNGYALVPTFSQECEITPLQACLAHFLPQSLPILRELLENDADPRLLVQRSQQNCLHVLMDRFISIKHDQGPSSNYLLQAVDLLLAAEGGGALNVNALDANGLSPLHALMKNPKISSEDVHEVLKKLVAKGADTMQETAREGNVLAMACKYLHFEAARFILGCDLMASEPASIDRAIEACMTMTGRATDKFVNLRTKTRELLKMWTGKAGEVRREKVCLKLMAEAGLVDETTGLRSKNKANTAATVTTKQLEFAKKYYTQYIEKKRIDILVNLNGGFVMSGR